MAHEVLVSIVVPIYNVETYLERCIQSILEQSYKNLQIILVDDGSTDESGHIADIWHKKDQRILVIHQANAGLSAARNSGIKQAKGDFILFVDSDDWIHPRMVQKMVQEANDNTIVSCGMMTARDNNVEPIPWFKEKQILSSAEALDYLVDNTIFTSHVMRNLYPAHIFNDLLFPVGKLYEDIRIMHRLFQKVSAVCVIPQYFYYYYVRSNSISNVVKLNNRLEWFYALGDRLNDVKVVKHDYVGKISSQMALVISLTMVQNSFSREEMLNRESDLQEIRNFLRKKSTKKYVKQYVSKKDYVFFLLARHFGFSSNKIYQFFWRNHDRKA